MVREKTDKDSNDHQTRSCMAKPLRIEKSRNGQKRDRNSTMLIQKLSKKKKNAKFFFEVLMTPAMPGRRHKPHSSIVNTIAEQKNGHEKEFKTMYGRFVESHESTRQRAESLQSKTHLDRIARFTSMAHYNWVRKFVRFHKQ